MDSLIVKNSRWKYSLYLLGCLVFVAAGIGMVLEGSLLGWLSIAFFGLGALVFTWQFFDWRPRLIIDTEGVTDRTLGVGKIHWTDIKGAYLKSIQGNDFICLKLRNPEKYLSRLSKTKRIMFGGNRRLGFTELNLNLSGIQAKTQEVFELVVKHIELNRRKQIIYPVNERDDFFQPIDKEHDYSH